MDFWKMANDDKWRRKEDPEYVRLLPEETLECSLYVGKSLPVSTSKNDDVVMLTNKRLVLTNTNRDRHQEFIALIPEVQSVQIESAQSVKYGPFLWATTAFCLAAILFYIVDHSIVRIISTLAVGSMGIYLIVDQLLEPHSSILTFRIGSSEFKYELKSPELASQAQILVDRLFHFKDNIARDNRPQAKRFAPR